MFKRIWRLVINDYYKNITDLNHSAIKFHFAYSSNDSVVNFHTIVLVKIKFKCCHWNVKKEKDFLYDLFYPH